MADRPFCSGPIALTTTYTANLFNAGTTTGGVNCTASPYDKLRALIRMIHIANKTAGAVTFRLYKGATGANAAGTELYYDVSVPANDTKDYYCGRVFDTVDFLVGGASANTSLVLELEGTLMVG